jgi:hypothetical protein
MPSVGIGEQHLEGGPVLFFERTHDSAARWRRELRGVCYGESQDDLKGVTLRPLGDEYVGASVGVAQAARIVMVVISFEEIRPFALHAVPTAIRTWWRPDLAQLSKCALILDRDLAYSPVKRNSASQGPSVWTTSQ